jgi:cytochrome bd-type quinol oxidase subunit 1
VDGVRGFAHRRFGLAIATGANVAWSLAFYVVVYLIMFPTGIAFMAGLVRRGPQQPDLEAPVDQIESGRPHEPFDSAARAAPQL